MSIGKAIHDLGIYDLAVMEAIWRLVDSEDIAVDAGANTGQMTLAMGMRAASVYTFEPHPDIFRLLNQNVALNHLSNVATSQLALSNKTGRGALFIPSGDNEGIASLEMPDCASATIEVETARLDSLIAQADFLKIDVEHYELQVLQGAGKLLSERLIRDIVFEAISFPSDVIALVESFGYSVFRLEARLSGPKLCSPISRPSGRPWETPNYLATSKPERANKLFKPRGWRVLTSE